MSAEKPTVWNAPASAPLIDPNAFIGKKPAKVIPVPSEYRRQTLARERDTLVHDLRVETNCHVVPHWDQGMIRSFDIYGAATCVEKATGRINHWISNAHTKALAASAWGKIPAYNYDKWYYNKVEEWENTRKQLYRGPIPAQSHADAPSHFDVVDWPTILSDELLTPRDVFGGKLERLDKLRMQDKVWLTLQQNDIGTWQIEIAGHEDAEVAVAKEHLHTLLDQVRTDASGIQNAYNIVLDEREGIDVELQQDDSWWPNHNDRVVPRLLPSPMMDKPGNFRQEFLAEKHLAGIQNAVKQGLDSVRHKKGSYDFAIRLGCLALSSKHVNDERIGETFTKDTFLKDINGRIALDVKKWLANDEFGYRILHRLMARGDVLEPTRSAAYYGYIPSSLPETRPIFRGTWVFRDPNSTVSLPRMAPRHSGRPVPLKQSSTAKENASPPPSSLYVVQVDWTDDEQGQYERGVPMFYQLKPGQQGPVKNMDVNMLELGESRGWHFALESLEPVATHTVPPILASFVKGVTMKHNYNTSSTGSFAEWDSTPTVKRHLVTGRLDSIYCFGIKDTCYKVELTAMWYPQQQKPVWGLAVRHPEWARHLAELEELPVGRRADWGDTILNFFPEDGQMSTYTADTENIGIERLNISDDLPVGNGLRILVECLLRLSEIVSSVTDEGGIQL
ncbi:hypothetical protein HBI25_223150 [Parastagonospora nodorum]|nr:hypothetical protein HBH51_192370 [Parastagonospora nodorum]KAH4016324.1 hypothetical protein HBI09_201630 [Parastagonospora nodorum]KAH4049961.1 hypothetical protein HBH49_140180 [Parastagonospora nodorum]KAH4075359.1 hypothetical protein HBH50_015130 [Parastagonospora nodorum]KAH4091757.1 hypothetical protein HBH46_185350 [Parastagonospora nodorum]